MSLSPSEREHLRELAAEAATLAALDPRRDELHALIDLLLEVHFPAAES